MKLTKQEQAVAIGTFISMLGQCFVNECIDKKKLESAIPIFNKLEDNTTPKQLFSVQFLILLVWMILKSM
ncbi:hypothetical protein NYE71_05910 [Bacillus sp. FSL K6-0273]|uniref:hypothetical protein n=1 Tax=Bacillus TaxID=1386 RepID=UPI000942F6E1|nr:hypothetical protein [Bacillus cereus]MCU5488502.1 hypothetical protein [Bacillus cereus]